MTKEELIDKNDKLREGYIAIQNNIEKANGFQKIQLEALYYSKIGYLEVEIIQLELALKAIRKQIDMAYISINRNEEPNFELIEQHVDMLLSKSQEEINIQVNKVATAKDYLSNLISPENYKGLSKVYRRIAKNLQPDVNPNFTPEQYEIWTKVLNAYNEKNVARLEALEIAYEKEIYAINYSNLTEEDILLKNDVLVEGIKALEETYAKMLLEFPFNLKEKITNEDCITKRSKQLTENIKNLKENYSNKVEVYDNLKNCYN